MMSDPLERGRGGFDERAFRRRRALRGLIVLAVAAVIVTGLMLLFGGSGRSARSVAPPPADITSSPATGPAGSSPGGATPTRTAPKRTRSATMPPVIHRGNPCPTQPACAVSGDAGLVAAVTSYRTDHHVPAVAGTVSTNAQTCALRRGSGSTCVPHYAWTNVPNQDAALAVSKIADFSSSWMLDPGMQRLEVGWAWNGQSWDCVLLKTP
jgi:hypothetical protein